MSSPENDSPHSHPSLRGPTPIEREFLLRALGIVTGSGTLSSGANLDWAFMVPYARERTVLPALGHAMLSSVHRHVIPSETMDMLRDAAVHNEVQNRVLLVDLADAVRVLEARRISSIALKGAGLLATSPFLLRVRHTDDIDLWVAPTRLDDAVCALRRAGYRDLAPIPHRPPRYDGRAHAEVARRENHELPGLVSPRGTPLEIHRHPPTEASAAWIDALARSVRVEVSGVAVRTRDTGAMIRDLCAHVVFHHIADPVLWPRHLIDMKALVGEATGWAKNASAGSSARERAALWITSQVLAEAGGERPDVLARRLVFPKQAPSGWGWVRLAADVHERWREGPTVLTNAVWPSEAFLEARGFGPD